MSRGATLKKKKTLFVNSLLKNTLKKIFKNLFEVCKLQYIKCKYIFFYLLVTPHDISLNVTFENHM